MSANLDHINFRTGDSGNSPGLLKDNGCLEWPKSLQDEMFKDARQRLDSLMQTACKSANSGNKLDTTILDDLRANYRKMKDTLDAHVDQITPNEFIEATRYLKYVSQAIEALKEPKVADFFKGAWKRKARNVAKLVQFMREKKLTFAPATPKDEAAYVALYHALKSFDASLPYRGDKPNLEEAERLLGSQFADLEKAKEPSLWL